MTTSFGVHPKIATLKPAILKSTILKSTQLKSTTIALLFGTVLAQTIAINPAAAKDPFTGRAGKPIGDKTEAVFRTMFDEGNYTAAKKLLPDAEKAEPNEPLLHALKASLLFADSPNEDDRDKADKPGFLKAAQDTKRTAEELIKSDPARGHLYRAIGSFLEAAHTISTEGIVKGTPSALGKLTSAFQDLGESEKLDPNDPELNVMKGAMDLMLAVNINLPLSNAEAAIDRIEKKAGPKYVADRILAWGYRDMGQQDKALAAVDRAIAGSPKENPELYYLKGQILVKANKKPDSVQWFKKALAKRDNLTPSLQRQFCNDLSQVDQAAWKEMKCGG